MVGNEDLAVRWTVGDVTPYGFEALRLSIWGAWKVFGPEASYGVCVNSVPLESAREQTGDIPPGVIWRDSTAEIPDDVRKHLDEGMAEGAGWKFATLRIFPDKYEIALDNDCILWDMPEAFRAWREPQNAHRCVAAEDVVAMTGQFAAQCGPEPRNGGIRGFPPGFNYGLALSGVLHENPVIIASELDEQGLQAAALSRHARPLVVRIEEVSISSPWPPHLPGFGLCGAHFVGLNARSLSRDWEGRDAVESTREHWMRHRDRIVERVMPATPLPQI